MMNHLIITTPEELKAIVGQAIAEHLPSAVCAEPLPDTITLNTAIELLEANGYPTSRAKIYKQTSQGAIPHRKYGNKLVFSRRELLEWAADETRCVVGRLKPELTEKLGRETIDQSPFYRHHKDLNEYLQSENRPTPAKPCKGMKF